MFSPEGIPAEGWEEVDQSIADDWSIEALANCERVERKKAFLHVREEMQRVELLGTDTPARASYHQAFIDGGAKLHVYTDKMHTAHVGFYNRFWVNIIRPVNEDCQSLEVFDFAVSQHDNILALQSDVRVKPQHEHAWPDLGSLRAPFLFNQNNKLTVIHSPGYRYTKPVDDSCGGNNFLNVIDRRVHAMFLARILSHVTASTREDDVTW